jgi:hypothetical protein
VYTKIQKQNKNYDVCKLNKLWNNFYPQQSITLKKKHEQMGSIIKRPIILECKNIKINLVQIDSEPPNQI